MDQLSYAGFAFIAGLSNGAAYRYSGDNLLAPVLAHSITDTVWAFVFSG